MAVHPHNQINPPKPVRRSATAADPRSDNYRKDLQGFQKLKEESREEAADNRTYDRHPGIGPVAGTFAFNGQQ